MAKSYVLTPTAAKHLKEIWKYSKERWGREQALKYTNQIKMVLEGLCLNPEKGRAFERLTTGLRYRRAGSHFVFYLIDSDQIQVVGILHEQMNHVHHLKAQE